jgi:hypothetical protein
MEYWSNGFSFFSSIPSLQYSNTPVLQHSSTPTLQYSNTPVLQLLYLPSLLDSQYIKHDGKSAAGNNDGDDPCDYGGCRGIADGR